MREKGKQFWIKNRVYLFIIAVVLLVASAPLFTTLIHFGHDVGFHLQRILAIKTGLEAGNYPVRIYKDAFGGYGYGAPLFYPDIFLYLPAVFCMWGMPLATSYNVFLILINILTMCVSYYSYKEITDSRKIGFIGMLIYTLGIY